MRWRITIRNDAETKVELRGYTDMTVEEMVAFSQVLKPYGLVEASPVERHYDPFDSKQEPQW